MHSLCRWAVLLIAVFTAVACSAQTPQAFPERPIELVSVTFSVSDHQDHFIKDVGAEQVTVLDNGKPAKLAKFESAGSRPLRIGILIDKSRSMWEMLPATQHALNGFTEEVVRGPDEAFVLAFDEVADQATDFTGDPKLLSAAINSIRRGGASSVWDAVYFACRERLAPESANARLAIVLISDTDDNQSRTTSKEAMEMAQRAGVTVYVIGADEEERGTYSGKKLAEATGGRALFPGTGKRSLDKALHAVAEELGAQYYVEFRPVDLQHDGQFHSIQVRPEDKKLKVRARKGYFAPKN
ncbi:MAG TPA: VWA domain-containing protein [Candidatus Angelobacter sp.]|nr:VWA domain-containing protein [Candidatus Angelobacter sp.]